MSNKEVRLNFRAEKHPNWKGNNVSYGALHQWVRNNKKRKELCENCNKNKSYDLANISGKYKRDINDFEWLCRKCHMTKDKRIEMLHELQYVSQCIICNKKFKSKIENAKYCSEKCKSKKQYYSYGKSYMVGYRKKNRDYINKLARDGYHRRKRSFVE